MHLLDDIEKIKKLDPSNAYGSIEAFAEQIRDIWEQFEQSGTSFEINSFKNLDYN